MIERRGNSFLGLEFRGCGYKGLEVSAVNEARFRSRSRLGAFAHGEFSFLISSMRKGGEAGPLQPDFFTELTRIHSKYRNWFIKIKRGRELHRSDTFFPWSGRSVM